MKKILSIFTLLVFPFLLVGCGKEEEINSVSTLTPEEICNENEGVLTNWAEGGDIIVCMFDDDSFCFIENLEDGSCEKGFLYFEDDENSSINNIDENHSECSQVEQEIICGKDGNTYNNRCFLEEAGIEEEKEFAHVKDGICVFDNLVDIGDGEKSEGDMENSEI